MILWVYWIENGFMWTGTMVVACTCTEIQTCVSQPVQARPLPAKTLWGLSKGFPSLVDTLQKDIHSFFKAQSFSRAMRDGFQALECHNHKKSMMVLSPLLFLIQVGPFKAPASQEIRNVLKKITTNLRYIWIPEHSSFRKWGALGFIFNIIYLGT